MNFDLKKPCKHCPFRTDVVPYLPKARARQILSDILQDATFSCHKHNEFDDEGQVIKEDQHCAGAAILLEKMDRPNQWMRIAERLRIYDRRRLDMTAPVYSSGSEMLAAYARAGHEKTIGIKRVGRSASSKRSRKPGRKSSSGSKRLDSGRKAQWDEASRDGLG